MKSSPKPGRRAVLLDANVLSRLARVHQTDVLPKVFPGGCYLAPAVYYEIEAGVEAGVAYLEAVIALVGQEGLRVLGIEEEDRDYITSLPRKLGLGEAEGIALCRRLDMVFVTHDRKAANFCGRAGVRCLHFRTLVDALQKRGLLAPEQAQQALE
jgi:predicted nucleic acid-binding protein